jgi:hypothetical protein
LNYYWYYQLTNSIVDQRVFPSYHSLIHQLPLRRKFHVIMFFQASSIILSALIISSEAVSIRGLGPELVNRGLGFESALVAREPQNRNGFGGNNNAAKQSSSAKASATTAATNGGGGGGGSACLDTKAIQTGSQSTGQNPPVQGQSASAT